MRSHGTHARCRNIPDPNVAELFGQPRDLIGIAASARAALAADTPKGMSRQVWEKMPRLVLDLAERFLMAEYSLQSGLLMVARCDEKGAVPIAWLEHDTQRWQDNVVNALGAEGWIARGAWDIGPHVAQVLLGCALVMEHHADGPDQGGGSWLVWSHKHRLWWAPNQAGYTSRITKAGQYSHAEATAICAMPHDLVCGGLPHAMMVPVPDGMRHLYEAELVHQAVLDTINAARSVPAGQDRNR